MSTLGNQTMVNDYKSFYIRSGSLEGGVPSPFSVVDETGPPVGSKVVITSIDNAGAVTNYNASGGTLGAVQFAPSGTASLVSSSPPVSGVNVECSTTGTRVHQPLTVQSGSTSGLVLSNNLLGTGVIANNTPGLPFGTGIALNQFGTVNVNNGNLICGSNVVALGVQNSSFPAIIANGGSNLQWWGTSTTVDGNIARASAGVLNINAQSNLVMSVSGQTRIYASTTGMDLLGNIGIPATTGNLSLNGNNINMGSGQILYPSALTMNNGSAIGGVGTINMVNGLGFGSGTINGLSNINTAGNQDVTITGYNPSNPTPLITLGSEGNISNANAIADTNLNGTTMTYGSTANNPQGGIRTYLQQNVPANSTTFYGFKGAGLWLFSAQDQNNPAGWSFTMRLFSPSNAQDLLSVGSTPGWFFNNTAAYSFDAGLAGGAGPYTITATRLGAW